MDLDLPIIGVCIVADPNKCPPNYTLIDKTYGAIPEDADLWKDRMWGRRVTRYLCVERGYQDQCQNVLVDIAITNEKDPVVPGFTAVDFTYDTREKASKKKMLWVRWMDKSMTKDVITELIFLGRNVRKPPPSFTLVGDLNGFCMCYKMGRLAVPVYNDQQVNPVAVNNYHNDTLNVSNLGSSLPYPINPAHAASTAAPSINPAGPGNSSAPVHALGGVPWQLNPKLQSLSELQNIALPTMKYKSLYDVEREYDYDFNIERSIVSGK